MMMTFLELAVKHLVDNGMFEKQALETIAMAREDDLFKGNMDGRWGDNLSGYPEMMQKIFLLSLNAVAVKYIDENIPLAWYRPVFAGESANGTPPTAPTRKGE